MRLDEIDEVCVLLVRYVVDDRDLRQSTDHSKHPAALRPLEGKEPETFCSDLGLIDLHWTRQHDVRSYLLGKIPGASFPEDFEHGLVTILRVADLLCHLSSRSHEP